MADHDGHTVNVGPVTVGITGEVDPDRLLRLYAAEVDRLRAMVLKHGDHTPACRYRRAEGDGRHCLPSCGWDTSDHDGHTIDAGPVTVGTCGCSNNFGHTCEEVDRLRADNATLERKLSAALVDVVNMANEETAAAMADEEAIDELRADNATMRDLLAKALPWIDDNDSHDDYLLTVAIREALGEGS